MTISANYAMNPKKRSESTRNVVRYSVDLPTELYGQLKNLVNQRGSTLERKQKGEENEL